MLRRRRMRLRVLRPGQVLRHQLPGRLPVLRPRRQGRHLLERAGRGRGPEQPVRGQGRRGLRHRRQVRRQRRLPHLRRRHPVQHRRLRRRSPPRAAAPAGASASPVTLLLHALRLRPGQHVPRRLQHLRRVPRRQTSASRGAAARSRRGASARTAPSAPPASAPRASAATRPAPRAASPAPWPPPSASAPRPHRSGPAQPVRRPGAPSCGTDGYCDGNGGCRRYDANTVCVGAACSGTTYSAPRKCNGSGTCAAAASEPVLAVRLRDRRLQVHLHGRHRLRLAQQVPERRLRARHHRRQLLQPPAAAHLGQVRRGQHVVGLRRRLHQALDQPQHREPAVAFRLRGQRLVQHHQPPQRQVSRHRGAGHRRRRQGGPNACGAANSQQWKLVPAGTNVYRIVNRHSSKALDVLAQGTADGAAIGQWTVNGTLNQKWLLTSVGGAPTIALWRYYSGSLKDDYETTAASPPAGYITVGSFGYIYTTNQVNTWPIYSCKLAGTNDKFVSKYSNCEGQTANRRPNRLRPRPPRRRLQAGVPLLDRRLAGPPAHRVDELRGPRRGARLRRRPDRVRPQPALTGPPRSTSSLARPRRVEAEARPDVSRACYRPLTGSSPTRHGRCYRPSCRT